MILDGSFASNVQHGYDVISPVMILDGSKINENWNIMIYNESVKFLATN